MLIVANGVGRILMNVFNNLRDALFAKVGQHAVRKLAYKTFVHMHELSLRYHLQRRTGGLSRVIERGVNGIETIVRFTILNTVADDPRIPLRRGGHHLAVRLDLPRSSSRSPSCSTSGSR